MEKHAGKIIEKAIRRSGISIAETGRRLHVTRRSMYNWFKRDELCRSVIYQVGCAINHDFSADFPNLYDQHYVYFRRLTHNKIPEKTIDDAQLWRDKYINLLEKYTELIRAGGYN